MEIIYYINMFNMLTVFSLAFSIGYNWLYRTSRYTFSATDDCHEYRWNPEAMGLPPAVPHGRAAALNSPSSIPLHPATHRYFTRHSLRSAGS
jgi:hypothetical protein